ncbi:MAG: hypothetical protein Ta2F_07720 [Termitinemataceae bacterium]|nr:MAG: hypothetical protein Ta2F_07720 [Termitinemataceae bacterium]
MDSFGFLSKTALQVNIKSEYLNAATGGAWTKIELRYAGVDTGVFIGEQKIPANITYQPNSLRTYNYDNAENENGSAFIMIFVNPPQGGSLTKNSIMIDEIILEDSTDELWLNSGGRFRYQNDDVILSVKKKAAIEKVSFETAVETAARGTLETEEDTAYFGALQRSSAGVVIFGTKLSGQFAYSAGTESSYWWNGGHGISRNIGPVFLGETFFTDPEKAVWQHSTEIRLNGNIYAHVSGSSNANDGKELRNFSAGFGVSKIGKVPLGISLDANAAYTEKLKDLEENETDIYNNGIKDNEANTTNYAKTWLRSAEGIIIDNGSNAQQRNISHAFNIGLNTIPVGVQLTLDGINTSSVLDSKIDSGTGSVLKFPFKAKSISGSFTQERIFKRRVLFLSDTFINDLYAWGDAIQTSTALLCNAPFYSLFDPDLTDKLHNTLKDSYGTSEYGRFQDRYRFLIRLAERYGLSTLYIPKSFEAQIYRETSQTYDTILDMINVGAAVHFSAINLFGAFGAKNIFKFYQNDQYNTSIFYDISIPKESDLNWRFGVNQDIAFYGFKGGELALSDVINILKTGYTMAFNISLLTPAKRSLLGTIFDLIINRFENKSHFPLFAKIAGSGNERLREEEVELFFNNTSDSFNWSINASHKTIVRILGTLNLNVFAGLGLNTVNPKENPEQKTIFFTGTIGTSISIQF